MSYVFAVIGATGNVGREMLNILAERNFPVAGVFLALGPMIYPSEPACLSLAFR